MMIMVTKVRAVQNRMEIEYLINFVLLVLFKFSQRILSGSMAFLTIRYFPINLQKIKKHEALLEMFIGIFLAT